jgi:hypothetical protein
MMKEAAAAITHHHCATGPSQKRPHLAADGRSIFDPLNSIERCHSKMTDAHSANSELLPTVRVSLSPYIPPLSVAAASDYRFITEPLRVGNSRIS